MNRNLISLKETLQKKLDEGKQLGRITRGIKGETLKELQDYTKFLDGIYSKVRLIDRASCLLLDIDNPEKLPVCKFCGVGKCLFSGSKGEIFREVCSKKCGIRYGGTKNSREEDPEKVRISSEKRRQTLRKKYGVDHISQLDRIKNKQKQTAIDNYGSLKAAYYDTLVDTIESKYGVDNVSKLDWVKLKKIETSRENWGTDYPWQTDEAKNNLVDSLYRKYGVYNISQLEEIKNLKEETSLRNFGVRNPSQAIEIRKKILGSAGVEYKIPSGEIILCDGFESEILDVVYKEFSGSYIVPQPEIKFWYEENGKQRVWFPDCIISDYIVEFKELVSCFLSESNIINKLLSAIKENYKSMAIIADYKNNEFVRLDPMFDMNNDEFIWYLADLGVPSSNCRKILKENLNNKIIDNGIN